MNRFQKFAVGTGAAFGALATQATLAMAQVGAIPAGVNVGNGLNTVNVKVGAGFAQDFGNMISGVVSFVMVIAALMVFLYLIWGGIEWITSGGDKGKAEGARNKITSAVIGLIVIAASYAILQLALRFLGFANLDDVFKQAKNINNL